MNASPVNLDGDPLGSAIVRGSLRVGETIDFGDRPWQVLAMEPTSKAERKEIGGPLVKLKVTLIGPRRGALKN